MRFESEHVHVTVGFRTSDGYCKTDTQRGCCNCGAPTDWLYEAELLFVCSSECYHRYLEATNRRRPQLAIHE